MKNDFIQNILKNIELEEENTPFLFVWENLELVNKKTEEYAIQILKELKIPNSYLFKIEDNWNNIKLEEVKNFLKKSNSNPWYKIQIFLIENFSRATLWTTNSCLKIFEEPWIHNIFFLTNKSESWILDTIISRCKTIKLDYNNIKTRNEFYYNLLTESIINKNSKNLISYFFKNKLEKIEYILFLDTFILFIKEKFIFIDFLDEIFDDKSMIEKNNVLARNIIDKWILKIINNE